MGVTEKCGNCGVTIGRLETPCVFRDHIVCMPCYDRLARSQPEIVDPVRPSTNEVAPPTIVYANKNATEYGGMICPNPHCGFRGVPTKQKKGSTIILIFLLLVAVIPGVFYAMLFNGTILKCPNCGMKLGEV